MSHGHPKDIYVGVINDFLTKVLPVICDSDRTFYSQPNDHNILDVPPMFMNGIVDLWFLGGTHE